MIVTSDDSTFFFVVTFKKHSQITRVTSDSETPGLKRVATNCTNK